MPPATSLAPTAPSLTVVEPSSPPTTLALIPEIDINRAALFARARRADIFPLTVTLYGDWIAEHPDTDVVAIPAGGRELNIGDASIPLDTGYSYEPNAAYSSYYGTEALWFPTFDVPDAFDAKDQVATLDLGGGQLAVGIDALAASGSRLLDIGSATVLAVSTQAGARFYLVVDAGALNAGEVGALLLPPDAVVGEESLRIDDVILERVASSQSFWFAWYGNFPDTTWWPAG